MQWVSGFRDFFYPFAAFWEWAPMTADVIAAIILCIIYLKRHAQGDSSEGALSSLEDGLSEGRGANTHSP